jgi:acetolactate synthase I/II/III large subunit
MQNHEIFTGADTLVRTLLAGGVNTCFTNPGTSEMHFVAALDRITEMRCILGLFEGVVTGAADGYYRVARKPAATLLHLAPGLGNGFANLHNAKKARSGIVNIVGDHPTYCASIESPLKGDIEATARPVSQWVRTTTAIDHLAADAAEAVRLARQSPGSIATLILPADISWGRGSHSNPIPLAPLPRRAVDARAIEAAALALSRAGPRAALLLGDVGTRARALEWAGRIADKTGCKLLGGIHDSLIERGAGRVALRRIPYTQPVENALKVLSDFDELVLAGSVEPVSFFAYPEKPVILTPPTCAIRTLATPDEDVELALEALAHRLGLTSRSPAPVVKRCRTPALPHGTITLDGLGQVIAALLPEDAIVVDESVTSGRSFFRLTADAAPHDWMVSCGASIGFAAPAAIGAAIAAPDRKVLALTGDGSAMYTLQALWTMARERLDVTIVVFANRKYQILRGEFLSMGTGAPGSRAEAMLSIEDPALDWTALATGHGVESSRADTLETFAAALRRGFASSGPYLVEVVL